MDVTSLLYTLATQAPDLLKTLRTGNFPISYAQVDDLINNRGFDISLLNSAANKYNNDTDLSALLSYNPNMPGRQSFESDYIQGPAAKAADVFINNKPQTPLNELYGELREDLYHKAPRNDDLLPSSNFNSNLGYDDESTMDPHELKWILKNLGM